MITLSYLHVILFLAIAFALLCAVIHQTREKHRLATGLEAFQNLLQRAVRSRHGAELNLNGHPWRITLVPVKTEDAETQEMPKSQP